MWEYNSDKNLMQEKIESNQKKTQTPTSTTNLLTN